MIRSSSSVRNISRLRNFRRGGGASGLLRSNRYAHLNTHLSQKVELRRLIAALIFHRVFQPSDKVGWYFSDVKEICVIKTLLELFPVSGRSDNSHKKRTVGKSQPKAYFY